MARLKGNDGQYRNDAQSGGELELKGNDGQYWG